MLAADRMERAHYAATNQREDTLNGIGMNIRSRLYVLAPLVPHYMMTALKLASQFGVQIRLIGDDAAGQVSVLCNELSDAVRGQPLQCMKADIATALYDPNNRIFI